MSEAGNGQVIQTTARARLFELAGDWGFEEGQIYTIFVRGRLDQPVAAITGTDLAITIHDGSSSFRPEVARTDQLEWHLGGLNFVGTGERFDIVIESIPGNGTIVLDRIWPGAG